MLSEQLVEAIVQERMPEVAEPQRQQQAPALEEPKVGWMTLLLSLAIGAAAGVAWLALYQIAAHGG